MMARSDDISHATDVWMVEKRHYSCFSCGANLLGMLGSFTIGAAQVLYFVVSRATRDNFHGNLYRCISNERHDSVIVVPLLRLLRVSQASPCPYYPTQWSYPESNCPSELVSPCVTCLVAPVPFAPVVSQQGLDPRRRRHSRQQSTPPCLKQDGSARSSYDAHSHPS